MKSTFGPVAALLISVSILLTGQGLQGTLLPVRASLESFPTFAIGAMGAAYFVGFTLGCLKGGDLVRRVGHVRVFLAMSALASASPLVHALVIQPVAWGLLRLVTGFCFAVLYVVIESWLNERSSNETRGIVFSVYAMITLTVFAIGQMLTLLYDPADFELFIIASVLVSIGAVPIALSTSPTPEQPHSASVDIPRLYTVSPSATLGCLVAGLANGAFWSLAPVFTSSISEGTSLAAWFMTSAVVGGAVLQWPIGLLSDKYSRRGTLIAVTIVGCVAGMALGLAPPNISFVTVNLLGAAWGALAFPLYTISVAYANDHAEPHEYVTVSSGLLLMYGMGATIGPFIASALMTFRDAGYLFVYAAISHGILAIYILFRTTQSDVAEIDSPITFSEALAATQTASHIYEEEILQEDESENKSDAN
jgi:MFS family permease